MSAWADLPPFIGKYNLGQSLGKGSFSIVKEGIDTETRKKYAIKIIPKSNMNTQADMDRFEREVRVILKMNHPGIIKIYNFLVDNSFFYLVMEFFNGGTLLSQISQPGAVSEQAAKPVFKQILETLAYIHDQGIAHRDIKLENVLYDSSGRIKIIDFGFSRFANPGQMFATPCGSPAYAAPEIIGGRTYDGKIADMWSMGVLLFGLLTGDLPWRGSNQMVVYQQIQSGNFDMPEELSVLCKDMVSKLMCPDPLGRFTAQEALNHPWLEGVNISWDNDDSIKPAISERTFVKILSSSGNDFSQSPQSPRAVLAMLGARSNTKQRNGSRSFGAPKSTAGIQSHGMMKYAGNIIPMKDLGIPVRTQAPK